VIFASLQAVLLQERLERRAQPADIEDGLHRATIAAAAQERAVGPLPQHEAQGPDENGFARARLPGNDIVTGLQLQRQIGHQREVLDAEGG